MPHLQQQQVLQVTQQSHEIEAFGEEGRLHDLHLRLLWKNLSKSEYAEEAHRAARRETIRMLHLSSKDIYCSTT